MLQKPARTSSLKAKLVGAALVTVAVTAGIVHFPWWWTSRRNLESLIIQANDQITRQASQKVTGIFNGSTAVLKVIENCFDNNLIDINNPREREKFYLELLQANPNFTSIIFGFKNGDQFAVNRNPKGSIQLFNRKWDPKLKMANVTVDTYRDLGQESLQVTNTRRFSESFYSPSQNWYEAANSMPGNLAWTDTYLWKVSQTPGINQAITLSKDKQLIGVISVAFDLTQVSDYLRTIKGNTTEVFIINSKGEIIAFTNQVDQGFVSKTENDARLKRLDQSTSAYLQLANQALKSEISKLDGSQKQVVYQDPTTKANYYVTLSPLNQLQQFGLYIGTVIPESTYTTTIDQNTRILFVVLSGFIVIVAILSVALTERMIGRPLAHITKTAADIENETFDPNSLTLKLNSVTARTDELGLLARVFQRMAVEVYKREQQLRQQVAELRIEIDQTQRAKKVAEITESDTFRHLQDKAKQLRERLKNPNADV